MAEISAGKDTLTGHWELMGVVLPKPFPVFSDGFPPRLIQAFEDAVGRKALGNKAASGTEILDELGPEHVRTGSPIVYTSADSVFQLAAHEEIVPLEEIYRYCRIARKLLTGPLGVARVIARPFLGETGRFSRTPRRKDFSLPPPRPTVIDSFHEAGIPCVGIGKIHDIFAGRGLSESVHTESNLEGLDKTAAWCRRLDKGLVFTNLVDFDMLYGHRNDAEGYAEALQAADGRIPDLLDALGGDGPLIVTADHGCDPGFPGTDHTREYVPVLVTGRGIRHGIDLGLRESFADVGATLAEMFALPAPENGKSFLQEILS
jgi:phosphopentomutase